MSKSAAAGSDFDQLVPDPQVFKELNITSMTGYRWDHSEELIALGWPLPIRIGQRKYRSRKALEAFKAALMRRAIEERHNQPRRTP